MPSVDDLFKGRHFDPEIIVLCVRWFLRYKLRGPSNCEFPLMGRPPEASRVNRRPARRVKQSDGRFPKEIGTSDQSGAYRTRQPPASVAAADIPQTSAAIPWASSALRDAVVDHLAKAVEEFAQRVLSLWNALGHQRQIWRRQRPFFVADMRWIRLAIRGHPGPLRPSKSKIHNTARIQKGVYEFPKSATTV